MSGQSVAHRFGARQPSSGRSEGASGGLPGSCLNKPPPFRPIHLDNLKQLMTKVAPGTERALTVYPLRCGSFLGGLSLLPFVSRTIKAPA